MRLSLRVSAPEPGGWLVGFAGVQESWRVGVRGRWVDLGGGLCAEATFESFSVRPVDLWGLPLESLLPEVVVAVPEALRSRSEWCTTYLDEEVRVGRGSGGALFLFTRGGGAAEGAAAAAAAAAAAQQQQQQRPIGAPQAAGVAMRQL
ncbi:hypothetical protein TSOC_007369 [Tetrabaena socialis]|uniref:Uncharacterized protein n=1 Tax=Tetrabaena socialis TaxID=47790 RepID=A0A2J8A184_9CHLO|nr:hypothetical protein TSOC_007369 [Tetrabaena socialis]|eukprot:PNH06282.1 hypothetical protein TSOC_007369 [Tetrabaena socialis]